MSDPTDYPSLIMVKVLQGEIAKANSISFNDKELRLVCWNCWNSNSTNYSGLKHYENWSCIDDNSNPDTPDMLCPDCNWMDPWVWGPFGKYGMLFS